MLRFIVHLAIVVSLLLLWTGLGLLTWIPNLVLAVGVYLLHVVASVLGGGKSTFGAFARWFLDDAEDYYIRGFTQIGRVLVDWRGERDPDDGVHLAWGLVRVLLHTILSTLFWGGLAWGVGPQAIQEALGALVERAGSPESPPDGPTDKPCVLVTVQTNATYVRFEQDGRVVVGEVGSPSCLEPAEWSVALRYDDTTREYRTAVGITAGAESIGFYCQRSHVLDADCWVRDGSVAWRDE